MKTYIVSCLIRPFAKDARVGVAGYQLGTGITITTWSKDWKKANGVAAVGYSLGEWKRVFSEPWTFPEWGHCTQMYMQNCPQPDMVRDIGGEED